jgi:uncharacterized membrane protein
MSGFIVLGPLFLSLIFIGYLVRLSDRLVVNPLFQMLPFSLDAKLEIILTKLAIGVVVISFVCLVGVAAEKFLFKRVLSGMELLLERIPLFNHVYKSIKDITLAFLGQKKGEFGRVVFVEYPRKGAWAIGFVVHDEPWDVTRKISPDLVSVFVPKPPNPATGFCVNVPKQEVIDSSLTVEEAVKLVISLGSAVPDGRKT